MTERFLYLNAPNRYRLTDNQRAIDFASKRKLLKKRLCGSPGCFMGIFVFERLLPRVPFLTGCDSNSPWPFRLDATFRLAVSRHYRSSGEGDVIDSAGFSVASLV